MCKTCGCSESTKTTVINLASGEKFTVEQNHQHSHDHSHSQAHAHAHQKGRTHEHYHAHTHEHGISSHTHTHSYTHSPVQGRTVSVEEEILGKNERIAERNRGWFEGRDILALNLVSSPGAGKTTLLERTILDLRGKLTISVVEGDQETANDAQKIRATGCKVVQINTGIGCHLDADMLARALRELEPPNGSVVMIENVGNLVCPALFDLGERCKVVILSVTEGEDKPIKYPHMFRAAQVMILNKVDLLPHVDFDIDRCIDYARSVNPDITVFQVSASRGTGLANWYQWLCGTAQKSEDAAEQP
jgi:hydrogenase nickel incorporation protein HypB